MMRLTKLSPLCFAATSMLATSSVMAWESADGTHSTSANIALSTDYMWRGASQTDDKPSISGGFDYGHNSGFYAGVWASNVDFDSDTSMELDVYGGFTSQVGDSGLDYDVGFLRYMYPGEQALSWNEIYGALNYSYFTLGIAYSADALASSEKGIYYSLDVDYDLPAGFAFNAGIGYYDLADNIADDNPSDYRIGVSKEFVGLNFNLSYLDSNSKAERVYGGDPTDGRLIFTISKSM